MMEIPSGKWCSCDEEGTCWILNGRHIFDDCPRDPQRFEDGRFQWCKCPACLTAYPNGATIEIKPK